MTDSYRIVVGMDLDQTGDAAMRTALDLARRGGQVELHVVYAIAPHAENLAVLSRALENGLTALRERVKLAAGDTETALSIHLHVRLGEVAKTLEQVAVDYDADLLVVGTHGRSGAARLVLGSVSSVLMKEARLPVLVARDKNFDGLARTAAPDAATPGAELHGDQRITDVLHIGKRDSHIAGML